jgi:hypothetical protein
MLQQTKSIGEVIMMKESPLLLFFWLKVSRAAIPQVEKTNVPL